MRGRRGAVAGALFGLDRRITVAGLTFPTGLPTPGTMQRVRAFPNLGFDRPLFLTAPPDGTDRLFVLEQIGRIRVFPNVDSIGAAGTFLDISARVNSGGEEGLLGLAFHPDYATNGFFYVYYSASNPRRSVISRFSVTADPDVADSTSEVILLTFTQPFSNHNGGCLGFGPDGKLYIASGDGGSGDDPGNHGQSLTDLLGKILRLNPDGSIPADNPFVGAGGGARGEIWAHGLRNPWRFSFDRNSGDLWAGDVGQNAVEEIDIIERGGNYGWRIYEGNNSYINPGAGRPPTSSPPSRPTPTRSARA
ncbi:MAG: PQQ-dependent sugar dehydrogenase [Planctomycetes bacterium]|nr:PQQ-dependent sugar dehydrogenase [Planctomycetota bacterium]